MAVKKYKQSDPIPQSMKVDNTGKKTDQFGNTAADYELQNKGITYEGSRPTGSPIGTNTTDITFKTPQEKEKVSTRNALVGQKLGGLAQSNQVNADVNKAVQASVSPNPANPQQAPAQAAPVLDNRSSFSKFFNPTRDEVIKRRMDSFGTTSVVPPLLLGGAIAATAGVGAALSGGAVVAGGTASAITAAETAAPAITASESLGIGSFLTKGFLTKALLTLGAGEFLTKSNLKDANSGLSTTMEGVTKAINDIQLGGDPEDAYAAVDLAEANLADLQRAIKIYSLSHPFSHTSKYAAAVLNAQAQIPRLRNRILIETQKTQLKQAQANYGLQ